VQTKNSKNIYKKQTRGLGDFLKKISLHKSSSASVSLALWRLRIFSYFAILASLLGIYAIANPNFANHLKCFNDCEASAADKLLNKDKAIAALINLKNLDKKAIAIKIEKSTNYLLSKKAR